MENLIINSKSKIQDFESLSRNENKSQEKQKFHLIGVGGGGCNALEAILKSGFKGNYTFITNPNRSHLSKSVNFILFPESDKCFTREKFSKTSEIDISNFSDTFKDETSHYIIIAAFGRFTGSFLSYSISKFLFENNYNFDIIGSIPLSFEGLSISNVASYTIEKVSEFKKPHIIDLNKYYDAKHNDCTLKDISALVNLDYVELVNRRFN